MIMFAVFLFVYVREIVFEDVLALLSCTTALVISEGIEMALKSVSAFLRSQLETD